MKLDIFDDGKYPHLQEGRINKLLFQINKLFPFFNFQWRAALVCWLFDSFFKLSV